MITLSRNDHAEECAYSRNSLLEGQNAVGKVLWVGNGYQKVLSGEYGSHG